MTQIVETVQPFDRAVEGVTRRTFGKTAAYLGAASLLSGGTELGLDWLGPNLEAIELRINLAVSAVNPPEAPLHVEVLRPREQLVGTFYNNLVTHFSTRNGLLLEGDRDASFWNDWHYAENWPYTRAMDAIGAARSMPGAIGNDAMSRHEQLTSNLERYWYNGPEGCDAGYLPGLRAIGKLNQRYLDDNLWIALGKLRGGPLSPNMMIPGRDDLMRSKQIYTLVIDQWLARYGGLPWRQDIDGDRTGRVLVSNAPASQVAAELFMITKDPKYYHDGRLGTPDAVTIMNWTDTNLRARNGLYFDGKGINGTIGTDQWTYGVGTVIGAKNKLHQINPGRYPLEEIKETAMLALRHFDGEHALLNRCASYDMTEDNVFNAILFSEIFDLINDNAIPASDPLVTTAQEKLEQCVANLRSDVYPTLLQQAGALHLAVLGYLKLPHSRYTAF